MEAKCTDVVPADVVNDMRNKKQLSNAEEYIKNILKVQVKTNKKDTFTLHSNVKALNDFAFDLIVQKYAPKSSNQGSGLTIADAGEKTVTWEFSDRNSCILEALYPKKLDALLIKYDVKRDTGTGAKPQLKLTCAIGNVPAVYTEVLRLNELTKKGVVQEIKKEIRNEVAYKFCIRVRCTTDSCECSYDSESRKLIICCEDRACTEKILKDWENYPDKKSSEKDVHNKHKKETIMVSSNKENVKGTSNQDLTHPSQDGATGGSTWAPRVEEQEPLGASFSYHREQANKFDDRQRIKQIYREDIVGRDCEEDKKYGFRIGTIKVLVYKMSITEIRDMDAIVNAANEHMKHSGGIAFYIAQAAGKIMVDECDDHIKRRGYLAVSEVFVSKPGYMQCKGIIHAVGPQWHDYPGRKDNCARYLYKTILSCLDVMIQRQWRKLALCAISSGIFGVPKPVCTAMYMKAMEDFAREHQDYRMEVHFIDVLQDMLDLMKKAHKNRLHSGMAEDFSIANSYQRDGKGNAGGRDRPHEQAMFPGEGWKEYKPEKPRDFKKDIKSAVKIKMKGPNSKTDQTPPRAEDVSEGKCVYDDKKASKKLACGHLMCPVCFINSKTSCRKCASDKKASPFSEVTKETVVKETEECVICMDVMTDPVVLKCGHEFCKRCLEPLEKPVCPMCGQAFGIETGTQPDGRMFTRTARNGLPGYEESGTIEIRYDFRTGIQKRHHPNPGQPYNGISRTAYLPDNKEGRGILELLKKAYSRRLIFTIGESRTTGLSDQITWNDIHHKTSARGGQFGYPDSTYLTRVRDELAAKGVTG